MIAENTKTGSSVVLDLDDVDPGGVRKVRGINFT